MDRGEIMQIMIFTIGDKYYGINTNIVDEIISKTESKKVPKSPDWVEGLINLRGNVVTTVNLSKLLRQKDDLCYNNIIIANNKKDKIGFLIKNVIGVTDIEERDIEKLNQNHNDVMIGIVRTKGKLINIIDISTLLSKNEG